jgi:transcription termination/antitermination protein NusG
MSTTPSWYAIHSRSNFERRIAGELEGKGVASYVPSYQELRNWKDRKRKIDVPLFPGYVFARFQDGPAARLAVLKTPGVVRILGRGTEIEPVPDSEIDAVRTVLQARVPCGAHPLLKTGSPVRVVRGPLKGIEGILERGKGQCRVVIGIPLLNQSVAAEVNASDVEPASILG